MLASPSMCFRGIDFPSGCRNPLVNKRIGRAMPVVLDTRVVTGTGGGPDKTILNSPRFLTAAGYRMLCAYMRDPSDSGFAALEQKARALQAPLIPVDDRGPWDWRLALELLRICRRERVTIWHAHDYKSNALGIVLNRFWPMHLVTTVHGWVKNTRRTPLYFRIDRFCLPFFEYVICVSDDLREASLSCGVARERCGVIENGVNTDEYSRRHTSQEAKKRLGFPPERLLIGAVGRLSDEKGFDILIRAVHKLLSKGLDIGLCIVGEGDQKENLQKLIVELGCQGRIRLAGYQGQSIPYYEAMDVFALSSLREGLPNVILESMALEVPIVATRVAGVPRIIQHEQNGLLVNCGQTEELTQALALMLSDASLRERLGKAGRHTIEMGYSFAARMDKIRKLYDSLLGRGC